MRIEGYRCDYCQKEHLVNAHIDRLKWGDDVPADWVIVSLGLDRIGGFEPWIFCSTQCLRSHPLTREGVTYAD